jgi:serine/threonine protein kinase
MTPPEERDPVDLLAEEFAEKLRRGERPSISAYAAAHPEHAEQIRQVLPAVAQMEQLKQFRRSAPPNAEALPDRLGDFRIVRELGRGGMGIVFEAMQESLGRRVALKVLASHAQLDPERRERFVREAKAAARLHHTNIVPVFGVGDHDGLPYYVMQLIPGYGLNQIISRWKDTARRETRPMKAKVESTVVGNDVAKVRKTSPAPNPETPPIKSDGPPRGDWNFIASVGVQVAQALHYAHQMGVLHRDVKPANLLLDARGEVWVVDFGLAKLANYRGITATGHIVGTLQYMAPECLHGAADVRSDVYGLGATLYELLTLSAPFDGESPAQIMKKIADSKPLPPRRINPHIPRDLETILLKSMDREPARRYASARLLAEDLQAFLDDRPIAARRETLAERALRWGRRHPAVAFLSGSTAAALILAAVVGWVGYAQTRSALDSEKNALAAEAKKRDEAETASRKLSANLALSLEAFEKVFIAAGGDDFRPMFGPRGGGSPPPGGPFAGEAADKAVVLEAVLAFYDKFAEQNDTNSVLRFEAARAHRRVGEMHQMFGRTDKAAIAFRQASILFDSVKEERKDEPDVRFELMQLNANLALGSANAESLLQKAAELGEGFTTPPRRWALGTVYLKLGWAQELAKKTDEAFASYVRAESLFAGQADRPQRPPHIVEEQASARYQQALILMKRDKPLEARKVLEKSVEDFKSIGGSGPGGRFARDALATLFDQLAVVHTRLGEENAATRYRMDAQRMREPGPGGPFPKGGPKGPPPPK